MVLFVNTCKYLQSDTFKRIHISVVFDRLTNMKFYSTYLHYIEIFNQLTWFSWKQRIGSLFAYFKQNYIEIFVSVKLFTYHVNSKKKRTYWKTHLLLFNTNFLHNKTFIVTGGSKKNVMCCEYTCYVLIKTNVVSPNMNW